MAHKLEEEVNSHPDLSFQLYRPSEQHIYRSLKCEFCENDTHFEIALSDNGQWSVDCLNCGEAASMLTDIINKLK